MIIRNGQALGSVLHSAEPKAKRATKKATATKSTEAKKTPEAKSATVAKEASDGDQHAHA